MSWAPMRKVDRYSTPTYTQQQKRSSRGILKGTMEVRRKQIIPLKDSEKFVVNGGDRRRWAREGAREGRGQSRSVGFLLLILAIP